MQEEHGSSGEGCCFSFALTDQRKIHSIHEDEKQLERWKKIEESSPVDELMLDSVVYVFSASTEYSKFKPWHTRNEKSSGGSGM